MLQTESNLTDEDNKEHLSNIQDMIQLNDKINDMKLKYDKNNHNNENTQHSISSNQSQNDQNKEIENLIEL